ncbi:MAG: hypothetical protein WDA60_11665 [Acidimicrobiia bacterium]
MPVPSPSEIALEPPLRLRTDGTVLAACVDALLAVPTAVTAVEARVVRSIGQGGDYAWLGFVTYHPSRGWERNGLAAEVPGLGAGRRIVVDLRAFADAVGAHVLTAPGRACTLEWRADALVLGGQVVAACGAAIPPVPEVPAVRDSVYLGDSRFGDITVESEEGRIRIPAVLVAHLLRRGAAVAELGMLDGDVYVVAQSERRREASTDPVIVAPVDLLMWSDASVQADFHERRRRGGSEVEQLLAALDPKTPVPTLLELLDTGVAYVRRRVAGHPALPTTVTDALASTGTAPMRTAVAANPALSVAAIELLARDPETPVRVELAANPALGPDVVRTLAFDPRVDVRTAVAHHPALPADVRTRLAEDSAACVRCAVAADPATTAEVVLRLTADADPAVSRCAAANPACPAAALETLFADLPHVVLANPSVPEGLLVDAASSVDGGLRAAVAANPSTPARVLSALARDPDSRVLRGVATNPGSPAPARRRAEKRMMTDVGEVPEPESAAW